MSVCVHRVNARKYEIKCRYVLLSREYSNTPRHVYITFQRPLYADIRNEARG